MNTGSPLTYNFNQKTPNPNDPNDYHVCHFFFAANTVSTSSGNTLAFQYMNNSTSKAITWSSKGSFGTPTSVGTTTTLPITTTSIDDTATTLITTTSVKPTAETTSEILTTTTTSPVQSPTIAGSSSTNITAVSQSSGLSGGPIAGIVIAILALIGIIAGLGFFFGKRARRNRSDGPSLLPAGDESNTQAMYKSENQGQSSMEQVPAWAGKQNGQQVRMGELYAGEQVRMGELHGGGRPIASELDPRGVVYELDHGHRNELP